MYHNIDNWRSIAPRSPRQAEQQSIVGTVTPATCARKRGHHRPPRPPYRLPLLISTYTDTSTTILPPLPSTCTTFIRPPPQATIRTDAPFFRSLQVITAFTCDPVSLTDRTTLPLTSVVRGFCITL